MRKTSKLTFLGVGVLLAGVALAVPRKQGPSALQQNAGPKTVDVVIALDVSSSMDGLIDGARQRMWDVVNLMAKAQPTPTLRVGLISYGNDGYDASVGWVRKESDLTTNLDSVYSKLFALRTNGGTEYVARAVHDATYQMEWSQSPGAMKVLFVAGNEPANQDPTIPVEKAVAEAREKGILVNTIYCGSEGNGESALWRDVATRGMGQYAAIDQNQVVAVAAPQDAELARLSNELNKTYVAYGAAGGARQALQQAQDGNAASASAPAAAARAVAKSSALYKNDEWDLLDARAAGKDVKRMATAELPAPMKAMAPEERVKFLDEKAHERTEVQQKIATLRAERDSFLKSERAKKGKKGGIDDALEGSMRKEAEASGFKFQ